jgi:hypothetical protein
MKFFGNFSKLLPQSHFTELFKAHAKSKPGFFKGALSGNGWRWEVVGQTLKEALDPKAFKKMQLQADINLKSWSKNNTLVPRSVEVVPKDWGVATLEATKKHGTTYSVLNMANSKFPGGCFLEGGSAQEENMWIRSTCLRSLLNPGIVYDAKKGWYVYDERTSATVNAQTKMTEDELNVLSEMRKEKTHEAFKVLFNEQKQICFRSSEFFLKEQSVEEIGGSKCLVADSTLSFTPLSLDSIFPFYEFRSAAPELANMSINWNDKVFLESYTKQLRQAIGAQLDTLIIHGKAHVVLGAWGCGSFKNKPEIVAKIYREEIEKIAQHFQHIVVPILDIGRSYNFGVFQEHLGNLKLGSAITKSSLKSLNLNQFFTSVDAQASMKPSDSQSTTPSSTNNPKV